MCNLQQGTASYNEFYLMNFKNSSLAGSNFRCDVRRRVPRVDTNDYITRCIKGNIKRCLSHSIFGRFEDLLSISLRASLSDRFGELTETSNIVLLLPVYFCQRHLYFLPNTPSKSNQKIGKLIDRKVSAG